jgi:hypothetical protein
MPKRSAPGFACGSDTKASVKQPDRKLLDRGGALTRRRGAARAQHVISHG